MRTLGYLFIMLVVVMVASLMVVDGDSVDATEVTGVIKDKYQERELVTELVFVNTMHLPVRKIHINNFFKMSNGDIIEVPESTYEMYEEDEWYSYIRAVE